MYLLNKNNNMLLCVTGDYKRVCYYINYAQYRPGDGMFVPENINGSLCTHIIYAFATISGNELSNYEWNDETHYGVTGM